MWWGQSTSSKWSFLYSRRRTYHTICMVLVRILTFLLVLSKCYYYLLSSVNSQSVRFWLVVTKWNFDCTTYFNTTWFAKGVRFRPFWCCHNGLDQSEASRVLFWWSARFWSEAPFIFWFTLTMLLQPPDLSEASWLATRCRVYFVWRFYENTWTSSKKYLLPI